MPRKKRRSRHDDDICPCCLAQAVFMQALAHDAELKCLDDSPVFYATGDKGLMANLGVLSIEAPSPYTFVVRALGEVVMTVDEDGYSIEQSGPWLGALAAIHAMLHERFGPVQETDDAEEPATVLH